MKRYWPLPLAVLLSSCATLNDSLELGAGMGGLIGGGVTYAGFSAGGKSPSLGMVAIGAGIGTGLGLLTSYLTHRQVESERLSFQSDQTEMHFGDLPPSPFVVPKMLPKKGGAR